MSYHSPNIPWVSVLLISICGSVSHSTPASGQIQSGVQPAPSVDLQGAVPEAPIQDVQPLSHHQLIWEMGSEDSWQRWWRFNQAPYLQLRKAVRDGKELISSDDLLQWKLASQVEDVNGPTRAQKEYLIRPGLFRLTETSRNRDAHAEVMTALARIGLFPEETGVFLRKYLASPSIDLAQTAAMSLGVLESETSLENLQALLKDDSQGRWMTARSDGVPASIRSFAAYSIGLSATNLSDQQKDQAVSALWETLATSPASIDLQAACVVGLGMMQPAHPDDLTWKLLGVLQDKETPIQVRALCPSAIARTVSGITASQQLRSEIRSTLLTLLKPDSPSILRQSCLQSMGLLADGSSEMQSDDLEILEDFSLSGKTLMERNFACISLAYMGASCGDNTPIRNEAARILSMRLDSANPSQRSWAGLALGILAANSSDWHGPSKVKADQALLTNFLNASNPEEKSALGIALGLTGQARALDPLIKLCEETSHPGIQGHAAIALGLLGDSKAEAILMEQLEGATHQPVLLERTIIGLALLGSDKAGPFLLRQIDPGKGKTPTLASLAAASRGLALIGDARTAPHLITAMDNKNLTPMARAYAAQALGLIADKNPLPWQYKISADLNYLAGLGSLLDWDTGDGILNRR